MSKPLGEGRLIDEDSDSDNGDNSGRDDNKYAIDEVQEDEDAINGLDRKRRAVSSRRRGDLEKGGDQDDDEADEFDHEDFMEQMLADMANQ